MNIVLTLVTFLLMAPVRAAEWPAACLASEPVQVVIRNDDICALSQVDWERKLLAVFRAEQIPLSVGVIPAIAADTRYKPEAKRHPLGEDDAIVRLYAQAAQEGWVDLLQHGYDHQQNASHAGMAPAKSSEFSALPLAEQQARIQRGRQLLQQAFGVTAQVFVPPWNNADGHTDLALENLGFQGLSDTRLWRFSATGKQPIPSRMIYFDQLDETLEQWYRQGQCQGRLPPETVVILYHSWEDYNDEGPKRLQGYLQRLKDSGVKITTISQALGLIPDRQLEEKTVVLQ